MTLKQAEDVTGKSESTMRSWAEEHGFGRRIGGDLVHQPVALAMFLDGDADALKAYHAGDRTSPLVADYFQRARE